MLHKPLTCWAAITAVVFALFLTAGCRSSDEIALDAEDSGTTVELAVGQTLAITLDSNPTTGYRWQAAAEHDELVQVGEAEFKQRKAEEQMVGVGGQETLRFQAKKAGQVHLELVYHRSWEKGVNPIETFAVDVTIK